MGTGVTLAAMRQQTGANDLRFRRFEPKDQAAVQALILAGLRDRWGSLDPSLNRDLDDIASIYGSGVTLTAWRGDCLVATGTLVPRGPDVAEVLRMSTAAGSRRLGIATRLLTDLLAAARARGVQVVVLETSAAWTDARSLYERHGFVLDREEDGEFCRDAFYRLRLDGR